MLWRCWRETCSEVFRGSCFRTGCVRIIITNALVRDENRFLSFALNWRFGFRHSSCGSEFLDLGILNYPPLLIPCLACVIYSNNRCWSDAIRLFCGVYACYRPPPFVPSDTSTITTYTVRKATPPCRGNARTSGPRTSILRCCPVANVASLIKLSVRIVLSFVVWERWCFCQ